MRRQPVQRQIARGLLWAWSGSGLFALAILFTGALGVAFGQFADHLTGASGRVALAEVPDEGAYSAVLYETDFLRDLRSGSYFRASRRARRPVDRNAQSNLGRPGYLPNAKRNRRNDQRLYRTVCVRLCDGFYFPISTATTRDRFQTDQNACQSQCGAPARLFHYPIGDGSPATMVDLEGRKYSSLGKAFAFRVKYNPSCKCRAHPWEPEAVKLHQLYATKGWQQRSRRLARSKALKVKRAARVASWRTGPRYKRSVNTPLVPEDVGVRWVVDNHSQAAGETRRRSVRARAAARFKSPPMGLGLRPTARGRGPKRRSRPRRRTWTKQVFSAGFN